MCFDVAKALWNKYGDEIESYFSRKLRAGRVKALLWNKYGDGIESYFPRKLRRGTGRKSNQIN
jgi:hypothetical protein